MTSRPRLLVVNTTKCTRKKLFGWRDGQVPSLCWNWEESRQIMTGKMIVRFQFKTKHIFFSLVGRLIRGYFPSLLRMTRNALKFKFTILKLHWHMINKYNKRQMLSTELHLKYFSIAKMKHFLTLWSSGQLSLNSQHVSSEISSLLSKTWQTQRFFLNL